MRAWCSSRDAEPGRTETKVADGGLAEQARQRLNEAGICAKPNAILKLTDVVAHVYQSSPWCQERDVTEILGHTTERKKTSQ